MLVMSQIGENNL